MRLKNPKAKGSRLERRTKEFLKGFGAVYTIKAGGSLGLFDVLGFFSHCVVAVQSKANRLPRKAEIKAIEDFKAPRYMDKYIYVWHDKVPTPTIKRID